MLKAAQNTSSMQKMMYISREMVLFGDISILFSCICGLL